MRSAQISQLKAMLSQYLARVKAGEELIVIERGKPIAKLVPMPRQRDMEDAQLTDLVRAGLIALDLGNSRLCSGGFHAPKTESGGRYRPY